MQVNTNSLGIPTIDKSELLFKIGDTFSVPVQFQVDGEPIEITSDMVFTCQIEDVSCNKVADVNVIPNPNQEDYKGFLLLEVEATTEWKQGLHRLDIKYQVEDSIKHSQELVFKVVRSITE